MLWPLTWAVIIGTLPGVFIGAWVRIRYLPDSRHFKLFAGVVLLYIGLRLLLDVVKNKSRNKETKATQNLSNQHTVTLLKSSVKKFVRYIVGFLGG